jgi:GTP cyclohydrolase I
MAEIKRNEDIPDIQNLMDGFPKRRINKVGIRDVQLPLNVIRKDGTVNTSTGHISVYTSLSEEFKGANMSRYRLILEEKLIDTDHNLEEYLKEILDETAKRLEQKDAFVKIGFDYFLIQKAPATGTESHMNYKCGYEAKLLADGTIKKYLNVQTYYTSLCPCSRDISKYGAHNQRSRADIKLELLSDPDRKVWIEDVVAQVNKHASAPIINGLKRADEKYQTELMYENPVFVEDVVRLVADDFDASWLDKNINDYSIVVNHEESIHMHEATAVLTAGRELQ